MEGIFDGSARDGCFLCQLLFADRYVDDCPRCEKRMRYQSAVMGDALFVEARVAELCAAYKSARTAQHLEDLCSFVHEYWPWSAEPLARAKVTIAELRERWDKL